MSAATTTTAFFPYMNDLSFIPSHDTRTLLQHAMCVANETNLHEFLATNRDGYCVPHVLKTIMPIGLALEMECSNIVENSGDWSVTYFMIIGMLECIARDGFDAFAAKFNSTCQSPNDLPPPPPVLMRRASVNTNICSGDDTEEDTDDEDESVVVRTIDLPTNPDFSFIVDTSSRSAIETGYRGVMKTEGWDILRNFTGKSFMFSNDAAVNRIMNAVSTEYGGGHSGASMGWTMRMLERISNNGFNAFKTEWMQKIKKKPL